MHTELGVKVYLRVFKLYTCGIGRGVGKGGGGGAKLIHFLYKVSGKRSVQKEPFWKIAFKTTPFEKFLPTPLIDR